MIYFFEFLFAINPNAPKDRKPCIKVGYSDNVPKRKEELEKLYGTARKELVIEGTQETEITYHMYLRGGDHMHPVSKSVSTSSDGFTELYPYNERLSCFEDVVCTLQMILPVSLPEDYIKFHFEPILWMDMVRRHTRFFALYNRIKKMDNQKIIDLVEAWAKKQVKLGNLIGSAVQCPQAGIKYGVTESIANIKQMQSYESYTARGGTILASYEEFLANKKNL